jgi:hypothetical protein
MNTVKNKRGGKPGPKPHVWKSGPDPIEHRKYLNWLQQKNQAQYRKESWHLDFETWKQIWGDDFMHKGRGSSDLCMTRIDDSGAWSRDNVEIITRRDHVIRQGLKRAPNWRCGPRRPRVKL